MTYLDFLVLFVLPPLVALGIGIRKLRPRIGRRGFRPLLIMPWIALIYAVPWDRYMIREGIWGYGEERVVATMALIPLEEYLFIFLLPFLPGLLLYRFLARMVETGAVPPPPARPMKIRMIGVGFWMVALLWGGYLLSFPSGRYLGLLLLWAAPISALMWLYLGPSIWRIRAAAYPALLLSTVYLAVVDGVAVDRGIWWIASEHTLGPSLAGLPVEEALFFLVTNFMVLAGLLLLMKPGLPELSIEPPQRSLGQDQPDGATVG